MEPPSSVPSVPRSGEDLSRAFRNLPPGTLSGLDSLCDHNYWLSMMRQAEIEISNEDIFRFRFSEISKTASNRLAFLAGSGEYGTFNLRYLIRQLVEQCSDMHKYTRKLEKYVVKLQRQVEDLEATNTVGRQQPREVQGGSGPHGTGGGGGGGGGNSAGGGEGSGSGSGSRGVGSSFPQPRYPATAGHHLHPQQHPQQQAGSKRPRSPARGSVEAAGAAAAAVSRAAGYLDDDE